MTPRQDELSWKAVLFDLDGTLIDTRPGMRAALELALVEVTGSNAGLDLADHSLPLAEMIQTTSPSVEASIREMLARSFMEHYDSECWMLARPYPGAADCLRSVTAAGIKAFVVTNKRTSAAGRLLERFGLSVYIGRVIGQDDVGPAQPKSLLARRCMEAEGLDKGFTVIVGDSDSDALVAETLHLMFVALTSGAGPLTPGLTHCSQVEAEGLFEVADLLLAPTRRTS